MWPAIGVEGRDGIVVDRRTRIDPRPHDLRQPSWVAQEEPAILALDLLEPWFSTVLRTDGVDLREAPGKVRADDESGRVGNFARLGEQFFVEEDALALLDELPGVEQEEHRVAARDVLVGDVSARQRQVVHAGGVD